MQIKPARPEDVENLAKIWHEGWHRAHASIVPKTLSDLRTEREFLARMKSHLDQTHVAWVADEIAGFFMQDHDEIYQFYVHKTYQGTDIAVKLMAAAEAELGEGLKWLACTVGNDRAARFYEKCGWVQAGTIPYDVETGEGPMVIGVWRYEKRIGPPS